MMTIPQASLQAVQNGFPASTVEKPTWNPSCSMSNIPVQELWQMIGSHNQMFHCICCTEAKQIRPALTCCSAVLAPVCCLELAATRAQHGVEPTLFMNQSFMNRFVHEPIFAKWFMIMVLFVNQFLCGPFAEETIICEPIL